MNLGSFTHNPVLYEEYHGIVSIRIDNPEKRNAISTPIVSRILECLKAAEEDPSVGVVIITGSGDRAFASGADLDELPNVFETPERARAYDETVTSLYEAIEASRLPVIARMAGAAIGGGCLLALACDLRIASANVRVGLPAARIGLMLSPHEYELILDYLPLPQAKRLLFTAQRLTAQEAADMGLIDQVVPPEKLDRAVEHTARTILEAAPLVIAASKRITHAIKRGRGVEEAVSRGYRSIYPSDDLTEGLTALKEKRKPVFRQ